MASTYQPIRNEESRIDVELDDDEQELRLQPENREAHPPSTGLSFTGVQEDFTRRLQEVRYEQWPLALGVTLTLAGVVTSCLGVLESTLLAQLDDKSGKRFFFYLGKENAYGMALWAGAMLLVSGVLGIRASITRRYTTVFNFFGMVVLALKITTYALIVIYVGYGLGWTPIHSSLRVVICHHFASTAVMMGWMLEVAAFLHYYEDICCGRIRLCSRFFHRCCPCFYEGGEPLRLPPYSRFRSSPVPEPI